MGNLHLRLLGVLLCAIACAGCPGRSHDIAEEVDDEEAGSGAIEDGDVDNAVDEDAVEVDSEGKDAEEEIDLGPPLTYYEHAKPIIDAKCAGCHVDGGIGPMPLTSYSEVKPHVMIMRYTIDEGIMPPWTASGPLNHFIGDRRLTDKQKDTLLRWIDQGADKGNKDDEPEKKLDTTPRSLAKVDLDLRIPRYTPQIEPDDYRCFPLEWPEKETKYITALDIVPGDRSLVHHAIVYHVQPENAEAVLERDAAEEGPGYSCFGSTTGGPNAWLQSYEPGGYAQEVPGGLGFEVRPGSLMLLQVHYNTLNGNGSDRSHVQFTIKDNVERVGNVALFMNVTWVAGFMPIPANQDDVVHYYRGRPLSASGGSQMIYWVDLHMHALGRSGRIGIIRANNPNAVEPLLEIPNWDFAWQETYLLKEPVVLGPQDQLYLECHFDNTASNQITVDGQRLSPRDVNWGDGTTDEMCLGNVLMTPIN